ncbi:hypothetical protein AKJ16_DCAP07111 [Drosera capensis]
MATISPLSFTITSTNHKSHKQYTYFRPNPSQPIKFLHLGTSKFGSFHENKGVGVLVCGGMRWVLCGLRCGDNNIRVLVGDERWRRKWKKMALYGKFDDRVEFGGGGGGGGGRGDGGLTARALVNLVLAVGLTYLAMTGKLGWIIDAVVSLWCPNCGNDFQILKFTLNENVQLCPYCSQPFSVVGDEFVSDPVKFSNSSTPFEQPFSGFSPRSKKGKDVKGVVDIEADIKDVE